MKKYTSVILLIAVVAAAFIWSLVGVKPAPVKGILLVDTLWVEQNESAKLAVSRDPNGEWASVEVEVNNFDRYWFEVQLPNGKFVSIKEQRTATITPAVDSSRIIRIYDRKTNLLVSTNKIKFQVNG